MAAVVARSEKIRLSGELRDVLGWVNQGER